MAPAGRHISSTPSSWVNARLAGRIVEIDGLRGTAILLVLFFHYITSIGAPHHKLWELLTTSTRLFWSGVDLFFVLSGFLISGILLDSKGSGRYFHTFYMRRIHRIFPLYFGWLALFYIGVVLRMDSVLGAPLFQANTPLWLYPLFIQNNAGLLWGAVLPLWMAMSWSLAVEEQFYLLLPALIRFLNRHAIAWLCAATIALSPVIRYLIVVTHPVLTPAWPFATISRLDGLAMGVAVALLVRQESCWKEIYERIGSVKILAALTFAAIVSMTYFPRSDMAMALYGFSIINIFYAALLLVAICGPERSPLFSRLLKSSILLYLGRVSYAVYIFHQGVRGIISQILPPLDHFKALRPIGAVLLSLVITLALAHLSWRWMESKLIRRAHVRYKWS